MTLKDKIMSELGANPEQTDEELRKKISVRHQAVNAACHSLEQSGYLKRIKTVGPIKNVPTEKPNNTHLVPTKIQQDTQEGIQEDSIKLILNEWLQSQGWKTKVAWGRTHGVDILATKGTQKWIVEVKGCGSRNAMRVNYFISILGEVLQHMDDPTAKYSIALPDMPQFRKLWLRLPCLAKERTTISAIFVSADGQIIFNN